MSSAPYEQGQGLQRVGFVVHSDVSSDLVLAAGTHEVSGASSKCFLSDILPVRNHMFIRGDRYSWQFVLAAVLCCKCSSHTGEAPLRL